MVGSVETRVLPSLRKMESLQITSPDAAPDDPQLLDKRANDVRKAPELGFAGADDVAAE